MSEDYYDKIQTSPFVAQNIVKIVDKEGNFYGTGFFIQTEQKKYCITCHHCICRLDEIFIKKDTSQYLCNWNEEYSDMQKDLAVLELVHDDGLLKPLNRNLQMLPTLDVFVWGFSKTDLENFEKGSLEKGKLYDVAQPITWKEEEIKGNNKWNKKPKVDVYVFKFTGKYDLGFSGAPVCFEGDKNVIGIFSVKDDNNGYVIPIQTLLSNFTKNKAILNPQSNKNISKLLEQGNLFYEKRNLNDAITQYNKIIGDINYLNALCNKGKCLIELGKNSEAIELFKVVLDINPNFVYALNGMADALNYLEKNTEAIEFCDKALKIDPNHVGALTSKSDALNYLEKYTEAIEFCDKALKIDPNNSITLSIKGYILANLGKNTEAIEFCDKALKIDPNDFIILNNKAIALSNLGKYTEAIELYDKALKINPDYFYALFSKGIDLSSLRKYTEAIEWYDKALKINPNDSSALSSKGVAFANLGKNTEAIELYDKALKIDPNDAIILNNKAVALNNLGKYTEAIELYDKALKINPNDSSALSSKGVAFANLGKYTEAIEWYDKALKINPDYTKAHENKKLALKYLSE